MTALSQSNRTPSPVIPLKERQREARTALILQAAYDALVEKGYHEVSMDEIAAHVGISKGTLYLHFPSKEALIGRLLEQEIDNYLAVIDQVITAETTVRARLERILLETYRGIEGGHQFLLALHSIGWHRSAIWERLEKQLPLAGLTDRLTRLFVEGQRRGELDAAVPTPVMVSVFLGLMRTYGEERLEASPAQSPEELAQAVGHILFRGLLAPSLNE